MRGSAGVLGAVLLALLLPVTAYAAIGVGVGTGKIEVDAPLRAGGIYELPPVTVFNTGTETATYTMSVTLNEYQDEIKPDPDWFSFSPAEFTLEPKQSAVVTPSLNLPIRTPPGNYYGYLEAGPAQTVQQGSTAIGVAAASKLYFSVTPSSFLMGVYFRIISLYQSYAPWTYAVSLGVGLVIMWLLLRRFLHLSIRFGNSKYRAIR